MTDTTAREQLLDVVSFTECANAGTSPAALVDRHRDQVLTEAAELIRRHRGDIDGTSPWWDTRDRDTATQLLLNARTTAPVDPSVADLQERFDALQRAMAAPLPSTAEIVAGKAEDRALAERIHRSRPGVPLHHAVAVLETLRMIHRLDAAAHTTTAPTAGAAPACAACRRAFDGTDTRWNGRGRHGDTPWCRGCVDRCHDSESADHRCRVCATVLTSQES